MGTKDVVISDWLSDKVRFADLINGTVFDGKQVIQPEELEIIRGESDILFRDKNKRTVAMKRFRDVVMRWNNKVDFMILAGEAQSYVSYIMPVRNMLYDGVAYTDQIKEINRLHKRNEKNQQIQKIKYKENKRKNKRDNRKSSEEIQTGAEFLSEFQKTDHICPVITLVFYFGEEPWDASLDLYGMFPDTYTEEQIEMLHRFVPNYRINLVDVGRIDDCSKFVSDLRMVLELMAFRNDHQKVQEYLKENEEYFSNMDVTSSEAVGILLGCHRQVRKMIAEKQKGGEVDMCKALEDIYNNGVQQGIEQGILKGTEENENKYDALIIALSNAGRVQEIVRCTSDKAYKKKLLLEFGI